METNGASLDTTGASMEHRLTEHRLRPKGASVDAKGALTETNQALRRPRGPSMETEGASMETRWIQGACRGD
jgi:hypothetical protein